MAKKGINISGTKEVLDMLKKFGESGENAIKRVVEITAEHTATDATDNADRIKNITVGLNRTNANYLSNDLKNLSQAIKAEKVNDYHYRVIQNELMGAYVEFGTGAYIDIPKGWEAIAMSYYKNGKGTITAQPYMYPAYVKNKKEFDELMKNAIEDLTKKYGAK